MAEDKDLALKFSDWQSVEINGEAPSARHGHACALVGTRVYLFGGTSGSSYCNDLFSLDLSEETMTWTPVQHKGDIPSPRESPTLSAIDDELFLYGGLDTDGSLFSADGLSCADGLYVFKTSSLTWERCETTGSAPKALSLSASVHGHKLALFGGVLDGEACNNLHILDTITLAWTSPDTTGTPPPVRCDHASVTVGNKLYISCGSGSDTLWFSDLYSLDLGSFEWVCVDVKGTPPIPRDCTSFSVLLGQYLVLFGGFSGWEGDDKCFNDLHTMDLSSKVLEWESESVSNTTLTTPPPRYSHTAITHDKKVWLFSGEDLDKDLQDVWVTEAQVPMTGFEPVPVPRVRYTPNVPIPCPRKVVTPAPPNPTKPRDFEELRATYTKRINDMFDTLAERFQQLDSSMVSLESERSAFEAEKKTHTELYERQQQELKAMLDSHREHNEEWLERMRVETEAERRGLARQRAALDKETTLLTREQEEFAVKSKKLDAIMKQMQGLTA